MFEFNDFLQRLDFNPERVRLLRHDKRGLIAWRRGRETSFGCFASFQNSANSPYGGNFDVLCHFLPGPTINESVATALFVGVTRINDRWPWDGTRLPILQDPIEIAKEASSAGMEAFDLEWLQVARPYCERILIGWGGSTRSWSQWAYRHRKEILEIRMEAQVPPFPGFSKFKARVSDLAEFPQAWVGALASVRGVYLLVTDDGEQYVGSAYGTEGFMGRWRSYQLDGHGGNVRLQARRLLDFSISILEVASPDMSAEDIIARESFWKAKLGSRAHGLNAN